MASQNADVYTVGLVGENLNRCKNPPWCRYGEGPVRQMVVAEVRPGDGISAGYCRTHD
jgi:hypothetical protein